jgi:hypothetical protein
LVQSQPEKIVCETYLEKNPLQKRAGGVAQGVGLEFKPQYCKKKKVVQPLRKVIWHFLIHYNMKFHATWQFQF